ncbi:MAG TPA: HAMP domain-containing sensor histidine kinase [Acidimicrobiia bacterium]|nr:HAMP domain-containing sensor histidine kinase [Acidimicrobiia bacterium]
MDRREHQQPRPPARRRPGLRLRTTVAIAVTSLVLSTALAALAYVLVRESLLDDRQSIAMRQAYTNARLIRSGLRGEEPDVTRLLSSVEAGRGDALLRLDNQWFSSSVGVDRSLIPAPLREGVQSGRAGRQRLRGPDGPLLAVGVPITSVGAAYFEVTDIGDIERSLDLLARALAVAGVTATVVGAGIGVWASKTLLRPVRHMANVSREIVEGDLDSRLDAEGDADLAPLVASFNEMLDELRSRIEREARFASDVTHELRGPLAALAAAVEVVKRRRDELPGPAVEAVEALDEQVHTFNHLVLDLLEISRFDAGATPFDRQRIDLVAFLQVVLADRDDDVPLVAEPGEHTVDADPRRLQQVVTNLLDNASNYAGGAVAVVVARDGDRAVVAVEDAGPGVPPEEREVVFERFARGVEADRPGAPRGTGLGLALVAEHVRLHGGRVYVTDRAGGGSRFVVELPVAG